jgi:hypothetical protein
VTFNPTAAWVTQQLHEAFPYDIERSYLIFDRDAIFSPAVVDAVKVMGIKPVGPENERYLILLNFS